MQHQQRLALRCSFDEHCTTQIITKRPAKLLPPITLMLTVTAQDSLWTNLRNCVVSYKNWLIQEIAISSFCCKPFWVNLFLYNSCVFKAPSLTDFLFNNMSLNTKGPSVLNDTFRIFWPNHFLYETLQFVTRNGFVSSYWQVASIPYAKNRLNHLTTVYCVETNALWWYWVVTDKCSCLCLMGKTCGVNKLCRINLEELHSPYFYGKTTIRAWWE